MLELVIQTALEAGRAIMQVYENPETDWQVERKADNSPLTLADRRSHAVIAAALAQTPYPVLSEEGEHLPYAERQAWHTLWVVDPLDGTKEFIKRNGEFTVNIALVRHGVPVMGVIYAPVLGRLYAAEEGQGAFVAQVDTATLQVGERKALPLPEVQQHRPYRVVASRSHRSPETEAFIARVAQQHAQPDVVSAGSSLKLCLVAEGSADVYPRLAPTMEWDTAAGHAIALEAGCTVTCADDGLPLRYNKADLLNPFFVVERGC